MGGVALSGRVGSTAPPPSRPGLIPKPSAGVRIPASRALRVTVVSVATRSDSGGDRSQRVSLCGRDDLTRWAAGKFSEPARVHFLAKWKLFSSGPREGFREKASFRGTPTQLVERTSE